MSKNKKAVLFLFCIVFFAMAFLNASSILVSDDISYFYIFQGPLPSPTTRPLRNFFDVAVSVFHHYFLRNGRILPHFLLQSVLLAGKPVFVLVNSLAFLGLVFLFYQCLEKRPERRRFFPYLFLFSFVFLTFPQFGASVLWRSGSFNYLWMILLSLLSAQAFLSWERGEKKRIGLVCLLALGAGSSSENGGGMIILMALLFLAYWHWQKAASWSSLKAPLLFVVFASFGLLLQLLSPGNAHRLSGSIYATGLLPHLFLLLKRLMETSGLLLFTLLIFYGISLWQGIKIVPASLIFALSALAAGLVLIVTPNLAPRSFCWTYSFLLLACGLQGRLLWSRIQKAVPYGRIIGMGLSILIACLALITYVKAGQDLLQTYREEGHAQSLLQEQKSAGREVILLPRPNQSHNPYNPLAETYHLRQSPDYWFNRWYAFHYGVKAVTISNPDQAR